MGYVTVEDVQQYYGDSPPDEGACVRSIRTWSQFIDRTTRQWFEPRSGEYILDGTGTPTIMLPVPIISVSALYYNNDFVNPVDTEFYRAYTGRGIPDDRRNPRITLIGSTNVYSPYETAAAPVFARGSQNVKAVGVFGFVEEDDTVPALIWRACMKLVLKDLRSPIDGSASSSSSGSGGTAPAGPIIAQTTDGHSIRYASPQMSGARVGTMGITGDTEVDGILVQYRGPVLVAVSAPAVWQRPV